jgi:acyl-CoA thioesterase-2
VAAGRSVASERALHALHGFFLLPGRHGLPIRYEVERSRDGRSFSTRRVRALQDGNAIFEAQLSYKQPERGVEHQQPAPPMPPVADCLAWESQRAAILGVPERAELPMEMRCADPIPVDADPAREPRLRLWMRFLGEPPADPVLRTALLVYASDRVLLSTASLPHGIWWKRGKASSLDHALWIHGALEPEHLAGWLFYDCRSPIARDALGLCQGVFYTPEGRRLASVAQQGVIRYPEPG